MIKIIKRVLLFSFIALSASCGVKGDPVPPGTPAELGRGQPTYKRATEEFAFPDVPPIHEADEENEKKKK